MMEEFNDYKEDNNCTGKQLFIVKDFNIRLDKFLTG